ncbi:hypothetical protein BDA96_02G049900 [Sorghum bicolor]|uniref:Uncharacterized protein n=2 Tax=Sorghum bicolor TaxID=4558 RepID=A0A921USR0_SORBI|nr:hypothetical protein SORBI_3002G049900 [Sorghum bicolor]KAG0541810.1 hypothetical protein BDA96_02G049900 [Sorghum bicolor]
MFIRLAKLRPQPLLLAPTTIHPLVSSLGQIDSCPFSPSSSPVLQKAIPPGFGEVDPEASVDCFSFILGSPEKFINTGFVSPCQPSLSAVCPSWLHAVVLGSPLVHPLGGLPADGFGEVFSKAPYNVVFFVVLRVTRGSLRVLFLSGDFAVIWSLFEGHSVLRLLP